MPVRDRTGAAARHSEQRIRIALAHTTETNPRYRLLLVAILLHDGPGETFPSLRTLARLVGCARTTIWRGNEHLIALGELKLTRGRGGPPGERMPNRYAVMIRCPADCAEPTHLAAEHPRR